MPSSEPDFTHRVAPADLPEWLDELRPLNEMRAYMKSLRQVNTLTFGARPTIQWLEQIVAASDRKPLRIVDVGCGCGDMLRRIEHWATRLGIDIELIGIDLSPETIDVAREFTSNGSRIEWTVGDALSYDRPFDIALSALLTHHLEEPLIVRFLAWMEANAQRGWFINDLVRERTPYQSFRLASHILRWHPQVRHDGPVSFRRAFREDDWLRMLASAGVASTQVELRRWTPGRLCVSHAKRA
jgi:2-polyprenyl-3-methyl-5-hydroxy-6-metoxy-1,4-benzoquinol methylase